MLFGTCKGDRVQERMDHSLVGIESLVGQQSVRLHLRQEGIGTLKVMGLAWRQQKGDRIA